MGRHHCTVPQVSGLLPQASRSKTHPRLATPIRVACPWALYLTAPRTTNPTAPSCLKIGLLSRSHPDHFRSSTARVLRGTYAPQSCRKPQTRCRPACCSLIDWGSEWTNTHIGGSMAGGNSSSTCRVVAEKKAIPFGIEAPTAHQTVFCIQGCSS